MATKSVRGQHAPSRAQAHPQPAAAPADPEAVFNAGRDLAAALVAEAHKTIARKHNIDTCPLRWQRIGRPQNRFAEPFLRELAKRPELIDGAAAALSAYLANEDFL